MSSTCLEQPVHRLVPGFCDFEDLYSSAVRASPSPAVFVEVGVWLGQSAIFMASQIAKSGKDIQFFAVDPWNRMDFYQNNFQKHLAHVHSRGGSPRAAFNRNVQESGLGHLIHPVQMNSIDFARTLEDRSVDFAFLDGDHTFLGLLADLRAWWPKIKPGGYLAGHDYKRWRYPGVRWAVNLFFRCGRRQVWYPPQSWQMRKPEA